MNKIILLIVILSVLLHVISAAISREPANPDAKRINKCRPRLYDIGLLAFGESKTAKHACLRVSCGSDGSVEYASCGTYRAGSGCHVTEGDSSKSYPECCPQFVCG